MRRKIQGFSAVTTGYGINILLSLYDFVGKYADFTISLIDDNRDFLYYIALFLFAYGFFRIGWTARTKGRIAAVLAGTLNGLRVADMLMEWGLGQHFGIAITLCLLVYLIWGQEKHVWIPTAVMALLYTAYYLGSYGVIDVLAEFTHLLSAISGIAAVVAISSVDEY